MNREDIIRLAQKAGFGDGIVEFIGVQKFELFFKAAYAAGIDIERERIKAANAPEIKKVNAHIKALEDAVAAEREIRTDALALLNMIHMGNESKRSQNIIGSAIRRLQTNAPEDLTAAIVAAADRDRMCEQFNIPKELAHEKTKSNETDRTAVLGKG